MTHNGTPQAAPPPTSKGGCGLMLFVLGLLLGGGALYGALRLGLLPGSPGPAATGQATQQRYHCPMHPTYTSDRPGDCPICGMKLVPIDRPGTAAGASGEGAPTAAAGSAQAAAPEDGVEPWHCSDHPTYTAPESGTCIICGKTLVRDTPPVAGAVAATLDGQAMASSATGTAVPGLTGVTIDPQRQQLIGLRTAAAALGPVGRQWRTTGRVVVDETRVAKVNVKVDGFVETLHVDFLGKTVAKGQALLELYSPELVAAQRDYLLAMQTEKVLSATKLGEEFGGGKGGVVEAARQKLRLLDVSAATIARLARTGQVQKTVTIAAPISGTVTQKTVVQGSRLAAGDAPLEITDLSEVWLLADVYSSEISQITLGMKAQLTLPGQPGTPREGHVAFIDPLADDKTRTVRVRLSFSNSDGQLRPGTYGEVTFESAARQGLLIPADAVIDSGTEKVVFLNLPGGRFLPRTVQTAPAPGDAVEVTAGLSEGDVVVVRANFLVDSESRLKAALAAMASPGGAK